MKVMKMRRTARVTLLMSVGGEGRERLYGIITIMLLTQRRDGQLQSETFITTPTVIKLGVADYAMFPQKRTKTRND